MSEKTLSIIKPDAVKRNLVGQILARLEDHGLQVAALRMVHLNTQQAQAFYKEHKEKPFFNDLVVFMCSEPVVALVLEGKNAIEENRKIMGNTNPEKADVGTIRRDFALSMQENSVHGSDSVESAQREISFFFNALEICKK